MNKKFKLKSDVAKIADIVCNLRSQFEKETGGCALLPVLNQYLFLPEYVKWLESMLAESQILLEKEITEG
jgi:hypothetical protein